VTAEECVQEMRGTVFEETKLTVSAGIAPNKVPNFYLLIHGKLTIFQMLAKVCSKFIRSVE